MVWENRGTFMTERPASLSISLEPRIHIILSDGGKTVFEPETAHLLRGILKCGSVHRACVEMEISYSKGRGMIKKLEDKLQTSVVEGVQGGTGGGSSRLTDVGLYLLERFSCYEHMLTRYAEQQFDTYFPQEGTA
jgi:molybdate transport system regulatory protein